MALLELLARPAPARVVAADPVTVLDVARLDLRQRSKLLPLRIHRRDARLVGGVVERGRLLASASGVSHPGDARAARPARQRGRLRRLDLDLDVEDVAPEVLPDRVHQVA